MLLKMVEAKDLVLVRLMSVLWKVLAIKLNLLVRMILGMES
jgi:hypothetical protein